LVNLKRIGMRLIRGLPKLVAWFRNFNTRVNTNAFITISYIQYPSLKNMELRYPPRRGISCTLTLLAVFPR
jgi:hypothetical protein